jgi:hypothetical protein
MSWSDDEIDKLVRDAFNEQTFEFRNEYWQDIERQLPVNKRRKPLTVFYSAVVLVSMISIGYGFFHQNKPAMTKSEFKLPHTVVAKAQKNEQTSQKNHFLDSHLTSNSKGNQYNHFEPVENGITTEISPAHTERTSAEVNTDDSFSELAGNFNPANRFDIESINTDSYFVDSLYTHETIDLHQVENQLENSNRTLTRMNTPKIRYWTETVAGIGQGWAEDKTNSHFANTSVGFNAGIQLPVNRFTFSLGAGLKSTFFDKLTINERTKIYGFSVDQLENTYTFKSVVSITLPISLSYTFGRQSLSFNLTPSMNVSCSLNKTQYMNGNKLSDQDGVANVNLFQKYRFETGIGYDYFVNEKLKVGLRCNIQLLQPIASDRFTGAPVKNPFEGQLYIRRILGL